MTKYVYKLIGIYQ